MNNNFFPIFYTRQNVIIATCFIEHEMWTYKLQKKVKFKFRFNAWRIMSQEKSQTNHLQRVRGCPHFLSRHRAHIKLNF